MQHKAKKRIILLSPVDFLRAYGGVQYIADALVQRGFDLEVFAHVPREHMGEARTLSYHVSSLYEGPVGRIPRARHLFFRRTIGRALAKGCSAILLNATNPAGYFRLATEFKKAHPELTLIAYCPEIWVPGEPARIASPVLRYYLNNINVPDVYVDVDPGRAKFRRELLGITCPIEVIPNTVPSAFVPPIAAPGTLARLAGLPHLPNKRIVLYTGAVTATAISDLQEFMKPLVPQAFLLWFSRNASDDLALVKGALGASVGRDSFHVCPAVPRGRLLSALYEADLGLIAYSPAKVPTVNQLYAAPTKLFEYIACGLPVVSFPNPSIVDLIEKYDLGAYGKEDSAESVGAAAKELLLQPDFQGLKERVRRTFQDHLSYERQSATVLDTLQELITDRPKLTGV